MYPMAEARGFQEPCERVGPSNTPTDHEAALQREHPATHADWPLSAALRQSSRRCTAPSDTSPGPCVAAWRVLPAYRAPRPSVPGRSTPTSARNGVPARGLRLVPLRIVPSILPRIAGSLSALCRSPCQRTQRRRGPSPQGRSHSSPRLKAGVSWEILDEWHTRPQSRYDAGF